MVAQPINLEPHDASVLITDDNDAWRDAVDEVLRRAGFRTLQAVCGEEAIEVVHTQHIDVALIDFHMPRLDGLETLRRIREEPVWLPAVLMTAHPADVPLAQVRSLHIEFVLTKPADQHHILSVVTRLVREAWHEISSPEADEPQVRDPWKKGLDNKERSGQ
jgi:CheY-like chemotaxis protein